MENNHLENKDSEIVNSRLHLLSVAELLFATKGYKGTSIRAIADQTGINSAMINYYYGSKEGLYCEIFNSRLTGLASAISEIEAGRGLPKDKFYHFLEMYMERVRKNSPFHRLLTRELNMPQIPKIKKIIMESTKANFIWLAKVVRQGIDTGVFKAVHVDYFVLNLFTLLPTVLCGSSVVAHLLGSEPIENNDKEFRQLKQYLLAMLGID